MRIAFDLDGVLADLQASLAGAAREIFGDSIAKPAVPAATPPASADASAAPAPSPAGAGEAAPPAIDEADADDEPMPPVYFELSSSQQRHLWQRMLQIENFWETLNPTEPGIIARIALLALERRWEVIFITQRPQSAGDTCQRQSQRWLARHGFTLPSVYVIRGSRGRVAAALDLDVVVDDRPENCLDVVIESKARAFLIWRGDAGASPAVSARRLNIDVVGSVGECLDQLTRAREGKPGIFGRLKRLMGSA